MVSWCKEWWWWWWWWWWFESGPGTGMALGPGGGARPCRDGNPELSSMAGLEDVWSGVPDGVLSSSELPKIVLFPFMEEVNGLWLLEFEFSLFSLWTKQQQTTSLAPIPSQPHYHPPPASDRSAQPRLFPTQQMCSPYQHAAGTLTAQSWRRVISHPPGQHQLGVFGRVSLVRS